MFWVISVYFSIRNTLPKSGTFLLGHPVFCLNFVIYFVSKNWRNTIFNINTHFTIRTTYVEFQMSTTIVPQGNLTSDHEIKQHIWQWKAKKDCPGSSVPFVILIIWMSHNNIKWSTIISLICHYLLTQPHSTLTRFSHLGKLFKTVMAKINLLHSSCCTIGDFPSVVSLTQK